MSTLNADGRWVQCAYPDCPNYVDTEATEPANYLRTISPQVPGEGRRKWYACEQHIKQVKTNIQYIVELKFDNAPQTIIDDQLQQLLSLIGYTYRKPLEPKAKDINGDHPDSCVKRRLEKGKEKRGAIRLRKEEE